MGVSTTISVLGGVGLFLLGMSVMTGGLKALAGSRLRETLSKAAATPLSGTFWGAFVTLIVQSSSATTNWAHRAHNAYERRVLARGKALT